MKTYDLNFKLVLISKTISVFGGNILGFAMILFLVDFTQSAALLGMISAISQAPMVIMTPFAGMIADRMNKKHLIVFFDVMTALSNFFFLWLLVTGTYTILNITILRMVKMSINTFAGTVFNASVPRIVEKEQLVGANGMIQAIAAIGLIGGSVVGGVLFGILTTEIIALASGILFLFSAGISLGIKIPHEKRKLVGGMLATIKSDMMESFIFLKNEKPIIFKLALMSATVTFIFPPIFSVGLPFIVEVIFGRHVTLSFGIAAIGMLAGGIFAGKLRSLLSINQYPKWLWGIGLTGVFLGFAFLPFMTNQTLSFWIFNITLAALLFMFALIGSAVGAFTQQQVPPNLLGKVSSLTGMISLVAGPLGLLTVGFFINITPLYLFFFATTVITWGVACIARLVIKRYLSIHEKV